MEVRPGYKQTEVGVIPEDWEARSLGDDIDLLTGFPFPSSGYTDTGVRLLRGSNVKRGVTDWADEITQYWPAITSSILPYKLQAGDLVIAMDGSLVGRSSARIKEADLPALLLQRVARLRSTKRLDTSYLAAFVGGDWFARHADSVKTVTAIPHISPADIRSFVVPVPRALEEQRAIAMALSDVDALLEGLIRLIAKKRDLKQAAMQQLLTGQARLPGFSGEWQAGVLADVILSLEAGVSVNSTDDIPTQGIPSVLKTSSLAGGVFLPEECKVIDAQDLRRVQTHPKKDTILISRMNTPMLVGEVAYVDQDYEWLYLPDRVWMTVFKPDSKVSPRWLAYLLTSCTYRDQLREIATGTSGSMKNISKGALLELPVRYPDPTEQTAIATILADMDAELGILDARLTKTRALKQAMMQELLTGKTRLLIPEATHA